MPWKDTCPMEERTKFIGQWLQKEWSISDLCRYYGVSRKTGHKWINRYRKQGLEGLKEASRAPQEHPNKTEPEKEEAIVRIRHKYPSWGPKKLVHRLGEIQPGVEWPAVSTAGMILKRHGLTKPRKYIRRTPAFAGEERRIKRPNDVWGADFKGWFQTGDGKRVEPLTISDLASRYLIACQGLRTTTVFAARPCFEAAFREYGLPWAIRTDNGWPFAGVGLGGLSRLSAWWIRLGITPERIRPGHPEENGRHERMHRSLKAATARPPKGSRWLQQKAFDRFRVEFNEERPHESLGMDTPAEHYRASSRVYPEKLPEMGYGAGFEVRRVRSNGEIKWNGEMLFLTEALVGELVGLRQADNHLWTIHFGPIQLGTFDLTQNRVLPPSPTKL